MANKYHKATLNNDLRLITVPMSSVKSVTVLIMIGAGSRYETKRINGISHFLEHMAFKGTKKRPSALAISSLIDGIGGEFNAFTSKDHTGYYIKAHVKHTQLLVDVLSDMLLNSLYREEEIEREKGVIIEEINLYEDTPARKIGDLYENLLYGDHPLGWDIAGKVKNIRRIGRGDFISYLSDHYVPGNCVVAVAGGVNKVKSPTCAKASAGKQKLKVKSLVERYLGDWQKSSFKQSVEVSDKQNKPAILVKYKKTNQAHLAVGVRAYPVDHPKRYALSVLTSILGGGMSSRLFIEVRERRGLAYYVRSGTERYKDVGHFATIAGVDVSRIEEAISVILDQYKRISDKQDISSDELRKAKEYIKGKLTLQLEGSEFVASMYASQEIIEGKIRTPTEMMQKIDKVTLEDVYSVARDIFVPEKLNLAVIGPFREKEKFRKLLKV